MKYWIKYDIKIDWKLSALLLCSCSLVFKRDVIRMKLPQCMMSATGCCLRERERERERERLAAAFESFPAKVLSLRTIRVKTLKLLGSTTINHD